MSFLRGAGSKIQGRRGIKESGRATDTEVTLGITDPMPPGPSKDLDIIKNPSLQRKLGECEHFCNHRFMSDQKID